MTRTTALGRCCWVVPGSPEVKDLHCSARHYDKARSECRRDERRHVRLPGRSSLAGRARRHPRLAC